MKPSSSPPAPDFAPVFYLLQLTVAAVLFGACVTEVAEDRKAWFGVAIAVLVSGFAVRRLWNHVQADRATRPRVAKRVDDPAPQGPRPAGVPAPEPDALLAVALPALYAGLLTLQAIDADHWAWRALLGALALLSAGYSIRAILKRRSVASR